MNEPHATLDIETYSAAGYVWDHVTQRYRGPRDQGKDKGGLGAVGTAVYMEHPSTELLTLSYRIPGQAKRRWRPGQPLPLDLFAWLDAGGAIEFHNRMFEWLGWIHLLARKYGWPDPERWRYQTRCSMAKARVSCYPGALANLSDVLSLPVPKDKEGKRLLDKFSVPRTPTKTNPAHRIRPEDDPVDFEKLCAYCDTDVDAEEGASARMPDMSPAELLFWHIDQEINERGIGVDREGLNACIDILNQTLAHYGEEFREITGFKPTQLQEVRGWLAAQGVTMDSLDAAHVDAALAGGPPVYPHPPGGVNKARRVLEIRQLTGSASVKKTYAMSDQVNSRDRLLNLIIHHGARTGRPTGEGPQPLNLPKAGPKLKWCACTRPFNPKLTACPWCGADAPAEVTKWPGIPKHMPPGTPAAIETVLEVMSWRSLSMLEYFCGDAMLCISGCVRGLFCAAPGHDLIASDYSSIEAVGLAELAGEEWRIEAFEENKPIYLLGASKITGVPLETYLAYYEQHGEHHPDRAKIGKISELACFSRYTQVLTNRGYVDIVAVTETDLLWDGVEWVKHRGLVAKGTRTVLSLDGVKMTPDHRINTGGSWRPASELALSANTLSQALATGSENLPSQVMTWAMQAALKAFLSRARVASSRIASIFTTLKAARRHVAMCAPRKPPERLLKNTGPMPTFWPTISTGADYLTGYRLASGVAAQAIREKEQRTTRAAESSSPMSSKISASFSHTSSLFRGGTTPVWTSTERRLTAITNAETCVSSPEKKTKITAVPSRSCSESLTSCEAVYDIAHAGPRNRFTIKTNSGHLLVHNCGYGGWVGSYIAFGSEEPEDVIKEQIKGWRAASPAIVEFWGGQSRGLPWESGYVQVPEIRCKGEVIRPAANVLAGTPEYYGIEGMMVLALMHPGEVYTLRGPLAFFTRDLHTGRALIIRLPSGRELTYHNMTLTRATRQWSRPHEYALSYMGWNSNPRYGVMGWSPISTYGPKVAENVVQAVCHDILRHAIINLRAAGYPTVLHVYDEVCGEVRICFGSLEEFEDIMNRMPSWCADWPVRAAGGWRGRRYRKS